MKQDGVERGMNWTDWASIAEIVGSAAIVVTLIYLSLQVRQNTDAMQSAAREATAAGDAEWLYKIVEYPELGTLLRKDSLSEVEASQVNALLVAFMRLKEVNFRQHQAGVLDKETWANYRSSIVDGPLAQPNGRYWWINFGQHLFDREFSKQVSQDLTTASVPPAYSEFFKPVNQDDNGEE